MGYKPTRRIYHLEFEDYPGLEVRATSTSLGKLIELTRMDLPSLQRMGKDEQFEVFEEFAKRITSWNIEHPELESESTTCSQCGLAEGAELPPTPEHMLCLDLDFLMTLIIGWISVVSKVSEGKGLNLKNGGIDTEALMRKLGEAQNPLTLPTLS